MRKYIITASDDDMIRSVKLKRTKRTEDNELPGCIYEPIGVQCKINDRHCESCGWNPEVAKARLDMICKKASLQSPTENED